MGRHQAACAHVRGRLVCTREPHPDQPGGHVYVSSDGSSTPDRHVEAVQE